MRNQLGKVINLSRKLACMKNEKKNLFFAKVTLNEMITPTPEIHYTLCNFLQKIIENVLLC